MLPSSTHKAFALQLSIASLPSRLTSLASTEERFYVGTSEGTVVSYANDKDEAESVGITRPARLLQKKSISRGKKPVDSLVPVPELHLLLSLCDGHVDVLDWDSLDLMSTLPSVKAALCMCVQGVLATPATYADPSLVPETKSKRICVATKKKLVLYRFLPHEPHPQYIKEISVPDYVVCMEWYGTTICVGHKKHYSLVDSESGEVETLPLALEKHVPLLIYAHSLFLLRTDSVGIFVDDKGNPQSITIKWASSPIALAYSFPYVIALTATHIQVNHAESGTLVQNIAVDDQKIQALSCYPCRGTVVAGSPTKAFTLNPIPFERQVQQLIQDLRVEDATKLLHLAFRHLPDFKRRLATLNQDAGMALLTNGKVKEAFTLFNKSDIDPRELISFFPDLPVPDTYVPSVRFSIVTLCHIEGKFGVSRAMALLLEFLEARRHQWMKMPETKRQMGADFWKALDTTLIKMYAKNQQWANIVQLLSEPCMYDFQHLVSYFTSEKAYHPIALLHKHQHMDMEALEIWERIGKGELPGDKEEALKETIRLLSQSTDVSAILRFAQWVFTSNSDQALQIFTSETPRGPSDWYEKVLAFLQPYGLNPRIRYLEHIILDLHSTDERYHTKLAQLYLEIVSNLFSTLPASSSKTPAAGSEPGLLGKMRAKLLDFLRKSRYYNVDLLLHRTKEEPLYDELVILYGRDDQHEAALSVLVDKLQSPERAETYCLEHSKPDDESLFLALLRVFLKAATPQEREIPPRALRLLLTYPDYLDPSTVLPLLPDGLLLSYVHAYLRSGVEHREALKRQGQITRSLRAHDHLMTATLLGNKRSASVVVDRDTKCAVCQKRIGDKVFARYPNSVLTHFKCMGPSRNICPVTGTDFSPHPTPFITTQSGAHMLRQ
eukprot:TRINITY_DN3247_c0_g1_i1.p1 TRINITY_DN3247_c0_g1~~TRINITY_DN3247_c0_g1_i1.p1  ORF type:complete len:893 (-),score=115.89 TRINITY_DN3247_c0_g1_i1:54-2732(-)